MSVEIYPYKVLVNRRGFMFLEQQPTQTPDNSFYIITGLVNSGGSNPLYSIKSGREENHFFRHVFTHNHGGGQILRMSRNDGAIANDAT